MTTERRVKATLRQFAVPVPPLPEQRCIVAILDEAFEAIATAKANAEKNLQNARELFESCLDATLSRHAAGYTGTSLGAEIELLAGYAFSSALYTDAHRSVRLLRGDNIMQGYLRRTRPRVGHRVIARNTLDSRCVKATLSLLWTAHGSRPGLSGHKCRRTTYLVYLFSVRRDFGLNRQ